MDSKTRKETPGAKEKLCGIIRELEVGMLTTIRPDGTLHTRPMVTRFDEPCGDLWFFTADTAPKAGEIKADRHVSIGYADCKRQIYAAVTGLASIVRDAPLMSRLWAPTMITWFPKGPDDPHLALLRVRIRSGEYWDAPSSTMVEIIAAVQAGLENPPPIDLGDHARVRLR